MITGSTGLTGTGCAPDRFSLRCYPNPFNPVINIQFGIPRPAAVSVKVYDLLGRQVDELPAGDPFIREGSGLIKWNAADAGVSSGIYFVRLESGKHTKTVKVLFIE